MPTFTAGEKEAIRLWYEFYKVARASPQPFILAALSSSRGFYEPWEVEKYETFNDWWKDKKGLFADTTVVRILTPESPPPDEGVVLLQVPLTKSLSGLLADIKQVLAVEYEKQERAGKSRRNRTAAYTLTAGAEPRLAAIREMLTCYRDVFLAHNPRLRGEDLLMASHRHYLGRKNKRWQKVPTPLLYDPQNDEDKVRALRNLRRYIQQAEQIVGNVASGTFPGDY